MSLLKHVTATFSQKSTAEYRQLETVDVDEYIGRVQDDSPPSSKPQCRWARSRILNVVLLSLTIWYFWRGSKSCNVVRLATPKIDLPQRIVHTWAQYSPAFPVDVYEPAAGCTVNQVNILQRHGARFPTSNAGKRIATAVSALQDATAFNDPRLEFVRNYTYDLGHDDLVHFGEAQSYDTGVEAFKRYAQLVSENNVPFVRASSKLRVVVSAEHWSTGFAHASDDVIIPPPPLILSEAANDTLDDKMCPNAGDSDIQTEIWQDTFAPPILERLKTAAPGASLINAHIPSLISLCAFDTLAKETPSPWCKVFEQEDFEGFEYYGDLDKYYNTGYGQALGPVQGVGYVNELLARLTGTPVSDATQTNTTLDSSPVTFPLNRTVYADFSHDNEMIAIYAAMGILRPLTAPDPTRPDPSRSWLVSQLVPFAGKFVTERLVCNGRQSVRMLLNDGVVPLEICGAGKDGICTLDAFVSSQGYSKNNGEGDWQKCFI